MGLKADLENEVIAIFRGRWATRDGLQVPDSPDLKLGNDGVNLNATVLYADLSESTILVDQEKAQFAAEIYKSYLLCAARIVRSCEGLITAYDGDRIMAVYIGESKNTNAVKSALQINYAVSHILNPALTQCYPTKSYQIKQVVGIDTSTLLAARTGIRGSNDLVWVGRAANYAAKLSSFPSTHATRISSSVYDQMNESVKLSKGVNAWEKVTWTEKQISIYRSNYWWSIV